MVSIGNSSMGFGRSYVVPLHGAVGPKMDALIAWIVISIDGQVGGDTKITLSVKETSLF